MIDTIDGFLENGFILLEERENDEIIIEFYLFIRIKAKQYLIQTAKCGAV